MKKLTENQFKEYIENPLLNDSKVRLWCSVPDNRYFSVSVWPDHLSGIVRVDNNRFRTSNAPKISKSNS